MALRISVIKQEPPYLWRVFITLADRLIASPRAVAPKEN